jgi:hypothetical protein
MDLSEKLESMLGELGQQANIGTLYQNRAKLEKYLIQLNHDIVSGKKELDDKEVDDAFREYNRLGRLIAEVEGRGHTA